MDCSLQDCIFFHAASERPNKALCNHRDAPKYVYSDPPCPLYRMDWQKKAAAAAGMFKPPVKPKRRF
jgi:hypothetical protein